MLEHRVVAALERVIGASREPVPLHAPDFSGNERIYVQDCIDSTFVSSVGPYVERFERMLSEYVGVCHAVAVVNGTAALHSALLLLGVGHGDEVLVPALTFVATANAVAYTGAVPHFVDSEERTLGVDPLKLASHLEDIALWEGGGLVNRQTGRRIRAIVPMHTFGHPVDLDTLIEVCERFRIQLVEDAAEAIGSLYKDRHVGRWGRLSILSFNGNKLLTTGGGGALLTDDPALGQEARHLTTTAKRPHRWAYDHDRLGYNYRMPNINAALGCAQLERIPAMIEKKRLLAKRYADAFENVEGARFFEEPPFARSNYWLNAILLDSAHSDARDPILQAAHEKGYLTRPGWNLMHRLPMYAECPRMDLSCAQDIQARLINLPSGPGL